MRSGYGDGFDPFWEIAARNVLAQKFCDLRSLGPVSKFELLSAVDGLSVDEVERKLTDLGRAGDGSIELRRLGLTVMAVLKTNAAEWASVMDPDR
jgi:hypothetical protein